MAHSVLFRDTERGEDGGIRLRLISADGNIGGARQIR
jgi:hypothetical protein